MVGPFVRWAGGKSWLCNRIESYLPNSFSDYYEPFLGGGAVYFYLASLGLLTHKIYLSDLNEDLIHAYLDIRDNCSTLIDSLKAISPGENEYYRIRNIYNSGIDKQNRGLFFIYLNRVGFNGIYRVSKAGKYNVPYGCGRVVISPDFECLLVEDSKILQKASIKHYNFEYLLDSEFHFRPHSLVFIDPPYTVSHNNNGFIAYNKNLFSLDSQIKLRILLDKIDCEDSFFIMTNAKNSIIQEIFDGYFFFEESRASVIGGKGAKRGVTSEYIVTNFERRSCYGGVVR